MTRTVPMNDVRSDDDEGRKGSEREERRSKDERTRNDERPIDTKQRHTMGKIDDRSKPSTQIMSRYLNG